jgi:hypothetical protein
MNPEKRQDDADDDDQTDHIDDGVHEEFLPSMTAGDNKPRRRRFPSVARRRVSS